MTLFHKFISVDTKREFYINNMYNGANIIEEWHRDHYDNFQFQRFHRFDSIDVIKQYLSDIDWERLIKIIFEQI